MRGIFIPIEFMGLKALNHTEMMVLSIYKYYTEEGRLKCCKMTNEEIYTMLGIGERTFQRVKKHLIDLGYIQTNGGISVKYLGITGGDKSDTPGVTPVTPKGDANDTRGDNTDTLGVTNLSSKGDAGDTHNKEKRKKEKNKEEKTPMTNFDKVIEYLSTNYSQYYSMNDKIEFIKENYGSKIDGIEELNLELITKQIKYLIDSKFGVEPLSIKDKEEVIEDKEDEENKEVYDYKEDIDEELIDFVKDL